MSLALRAYQEEAALADLVLDDLQRPPTAPPAKHMPPGALAVCAEEEG